MLGANLLAKAGLERDIIIGIHVCCAAMFFCLLSLDLLLTKHYIHKSNFCRQYPRRYLCRRCGIQDEVTTFDSQIFDDELLWSCICRVASRQYDQDYLGLHQDTGNVIHCDLFAFDHWIRSIEDRIQCLVTSTAGGGSANDVGFVDVAQVGLNPLDCHSIRLQIRSEFWAQ